MHALLLQMTSYLNSDVAGKLLTASYRTEKIAGCGLTKKKTLAKETGSVHCPLSCLICPCCVLHPAPPRAPTREEWKTIA